MRLHELRRRLSFLLHRNEMADDLQDEMRLHLDLRERKLRQQGAAVGDAGREARRQFGNLAAIHDRSFGEWGFAACERLLQDFRIGVRVLRASPVFTAVAVLTLAIGLGMNTAVFSVVNTVMLRALPYPEAGRLVRS